VSTEHVGIRSPRVLFLGRATLDVIYSLDQFPAEDTKTFARSLHVAPGGPATNAAVTHALLGGTAVLMTAIGGGPWSADVREELSPLGIALIDLAAGSTYETPLTTILVNETAATRTIVNPPRSEVPLSPLQTWDVAWGGMPELALTDGFHLEETLLLLRSLRSSSCKICMDGGSWKPGTDELAPLLSVAICSERFAVPETPPTSEATMAWFADRGVPHIAVTRGSRSIVGCDLGRWFEIEIQPINAVDTTGAGDVLHGAFCYHFQRNGDFEGSLRKAAEIATRSCRALGIQAWKLTGSNEP